jgi:NAD(P)-dependent dehydrogenase (short-subunit alcohol dehydrogenase family)
MNASPIRRCALITGGASGIGAALATRLAADGCRIVVADINADQARVVVAELPGTGHLALAMDVSSPESVEQAFENAEIEAGPVDILVNAAGVMLTERDGTPLRFWESGLARWETNMAINARGCLLTAAAYVRKRLIQPVAHGRIVLFSSVAAQTGGSKATFADYAASKAAVLGFMRAAARECAALGITVNAVSPGQIDTPMLRKNIPAGTPVDAGVIPLARFGEPADVAATIAFIVSADADFITGATFDVNGGQRMQ